MLLVIVGGVGEGDEHRRSTDRSQLRQRGRPRPTQDEIGPAIGLGHPLDERLHPDPRLAEAERRIASAHLVKVGLAGLVPDLELRQRREELRQRREEGPVDRPRPLRAAEDEEPRRPRLVLLRRALEAGEELTPDRIAGEHPLVRREEALRILEGAKDPLHEATEDPVGDPGDAVLLHDPAGDPHHHAGRDERTRSVAADADDDVRPKALEDRPALPPGAGQAREPADEPADAATLDPEGVDRRQLVALFGDHAMFDAPLGADEEHLAAVATDLLGEGDPGEEMPAGASAGDRHPQRSPPALGGRSIARLCFASRRHRLPRRGGAVGDSAGAERA